jgi:hypothetical protein
MATNTDTIPVENDTATHEATRPPRARPPSRPRRAALGWAAIITASIAVAALAVATFTGGSDNADSPAMRLDPQAEQSEREGHLDGQAKTYGGDRGSTNPIEAGNPAAQNNSTDDPHDDQFVPGSRHMPMR